MKKERQKGLSGLRSQKPLKKLEGKRQKNVLWALTDRRERERTFEKVWIVIITWKTYVYKNKKNKKIKNLSEWFLIDRKIDSINRKLHSIDPEPIEPGRFKTIFLITISISQETGSIDRNSWKKQNFEKQSNFMQKLLIA